VSRSRPSLLRTYLLVVGVILLGQGAASLLVRATGRDPHASTRLLSDPAHATIHVVWGVVLLGLLAAGAHAATQAWMAVVFGVFYVGLLVLGLAVHHPIGLMIDGKENVFHAAIGPLALLAGLNAMRAAGPRTRSATEVR
jgi:hypothetical protein